MSRYIAILRGINVGGKRKILMKDLKEIFSELGFSNIQTYVQSGNVVFDTEKEQNSEKLEKSIEDAIARKYDFSVTTIVRSSEDLRNIISKNPFHPETADLNQHYLVFLKDLPETDNIEKLEKFDTPDDFRIIENHIFIKYTTRYSDSKLSNNFFENKLKVPASTRNWKTVLKLVDMSANS